MKRRAKSFLLCTFLLGFSLAKPAARIETDPELTAGYVDGDMVLDMAARNGLRQQVFMWPNNTVYYKFFAKFDEAHENHILRGMKIIESVSCIRFKEATDDIETYVNITNFDDGCYSTVGYRKGGPQVYNLKEHPLDVGCFRLGTIMHEFLHTLGFFHMQSASNRDDYVHIATENIIEGTERNFYKYNETIVDLYDQEYDYASILHYSPYAFSANGKLTIIPLKGDFIEVMGQRRHMTRSDINKLNVMYRCPVKN